MYDPVSGVEAYIRAYISDEDESEHQYQEYEVPRGSPLYTGNTRERYIEAITDQRFEIVVILQPEFNFGRHPEVELWYDFDGESEYGYIWIHSTEKEKGKSIKKIATSTDTYVDGSWKSVGFAFGELTIDDSIQLSQDEEAAEVKKRGTIIVSVQRGKATGPCYDEEIAFETTSLPKDTTKAVAIDHGKSHSFKPVILGTVDRPESSYTDFTPAKGKIGKPIEFTFYYTSRMILEMKKILPETLAPAVSLPAKPDPIIHPSSDAKKRITNTERIEILDGCDDEELRPVKRVKTEPPEDAKPLSVTSMPPNNSTEAVQTPAIKTEPQDHSNSSPMPSNLLLASTAAPDSTKQSEKAKKRARIMLELEEIKFKKQLMELEEEGDG